MNTNDTLHLRTLSNTLGFTLVDLHTATVRESYNSHTDSLTSPILSRAIADAETLLEEMKRLRNESNEDREYSRPLLMDLDPEYGTLDEEWEDKRTPYMKKNGIYDLLDPRMTDIPMCDR